MLEIIPKSTNKVIDDDPGRRCTCMGVYGRLQSYLLKSQYIMCTGVCWSVQACTHLGAITCAELTVQEWVLLQNLIRKNACICTGIVQGHN